MDNSSHSILPLEVFSPRGDLSWEDVAGFLQKEEKALALHPQVLATRSGNLLKILLRTSEGKPSQELLKAVVKEELMGPFLAALSEWYAPLPLLPEKIYLLGNDDGVLLPDEVLFLPGVAAAAGSFATLAFLFPPGEEEKVQELQEARGKLLREEAPPLLSLLRLFAPQALSRRLPFLGLTDSYPEDLPFYLEEESREEREALDAFLNPLVLPEVEREEEDSEEAVIRVFLLGIRNFPSYALSELLRTYFSLRGTSEFALLEGTSLEERKLLLKNSLGCPSPRAPEARELHSFALERCLARWREEKPSEAFILREVVALLEALPPKAPEGVSLGRELVRIPFLCDLEDEVLFLLRGLQELAKENPQEALLLAEFWPRHLREKVVWKPERILSLHLLLTGGVPQALIKKLLEASEDLKEPLSLSEVRAFVASWEAYQEMPLAWVFPLLREEGGL